MSDQPVSRQARKEKTVRYVASLDGLRAIAALSVVIIHTESEAGASIPVYIVTGTITGPLFMVFFAISGFVLYRGWARRHMAMSERRPSDAAVKGTADGGADGRTGKYLVRRLIRIYPLYWVVATAALLISDNTGGHSALDIVQVYLLLPFPNLDALVELGLGIVVWTLIIDIVFYVYIAIHGAVMTKVIRRFRRTHTPFRIESTVYASMIVLILAAALVLPGPVAALVCLPVGMWYAVIEAEQDRTGRRMAGVNSLVDGWWVLLLLFVTLGPLVDYTLIDTPDYGAFIADLPGVHMLLTLVGCWLLAIVLWGDPEWWLQRFLTSPTMRAAGLLTYGTYLWHPVVLMLLDQNLPDGGMLAYLAITVVASIALAAVTYVLVERPLARIRFDMRAPEKTGEPAAP